MRDEIREFIEWHERVISKYHPIVQVELREARTKFVTHWKPLKEVSNE